MRNQTFARLLVLVIAITSFSACDFNGKFYHPSKINLPFSTTITSSETGDTLYTMKLVSDSLPPFFLNHQGETLDFDYKIESVLLKSTSGNRIHGWFIEPADSIKNDVTLLFLHGNGGNIISYLSLVFPFVKLGYQAFLFDYSGFGLSEGKPTRKNVYNDASSALKYIAARKDVKGTNIVIYGQSLGGHLSPVVAVDNQGVVSGVVIEGAFSSHKDIAAQGAGILGKLLVRETYSAKKNIKYLTKPVLIIHSTEDNVTPHIMGEVLFQEANEPKEFFSIDGCHICGPKFYAEEISEKIQSMLNQ